MRLGRNLGGLLTFLSVRRVCNIILCILFLFFTSHRCLFVVAPLEGIISDCVRLSIVVVVDLRNL